MSRGRNETERSWWNKGGRRTGGRRGEEAYERGRASERGGTGRGGDKFCQTHERYSSWPLAKAPEAVRSYMFARSREGSNSSSYIRSDANEPRWPVIFHFASFPLSSSFFVIVFSNFQFLRIGIFIIQIEILFKISFNCFERNNNGKME